MLSQISKARCPPNFVHGLTHPSSGTSRDDDDAVLDTIEYEAAAHGIEIVNTYDHLANQFVEVEIVAVGDELRS